MIRETWGRSWKSGPGERRWRSTSVYYGPFTLFAMLIAGGIWWTFLAFFVIPLWFGAEAYVLVISAAVLLIRWALDPASRYHIRVARCWFFWYLTT